MLKLYYMPGSCALASHISLVWASAAYGLVRLDHQSVHSEAFLQVNPKGAVPVLVDEESGRQSTTITESLAVLQYIADAHPAAALGAASSNMLDRVRLNETLAELVSEVHKAFGPVFVPQRFAVDDKCRDGAKQAAFRQLDAIFDRLDRRMDTRSWIVLNRRTVVDAYLYVMCRWKDKTPTPLSSYPNLNRYKLALDTDGGVRRSLSEEASDG